MPDAGRRVRGQEGSLEGILGLQGCSGCQAGGLLRMMSGPPPTGLPCRGPLSLSHLRQLSQRGRTAKEISGGSPGAACSPRTHVVSHAHTPSSEGPGAKHRANENSEPWRLNLVCSTQNFWMTFKSFNYCLSTFSSEKFG